MRRIGKGLGLQCSIKHKTHFAPKLENPEKTQTFKKEYSFRHFASFCTILVLAGPIWSCQSAPLYEYSILSSIVRSIEFYSYLHFIPLPCIYSNQSTDDPTQS
jgi:hypothetical protein